MVCIVLLRESVCSMSPISPGEGGSLCLTALPSFVCGRCVYGSSHSSLVPKVANTRYRPSIIIDRYIYYMCLVCVNPLVILLGVSLSSSSCGTGIHLFVPIDASSGALIVRSILPLCKFAPSLLIRSILLSSRPLPLRPPVLVSACLLSPLLSSRRTRFCVHVCIQLRTHVYTVVYTRVHRGDHYYFV